MTLFPLIIVFILGAVIGSFLNVVIDRLPQRRSIWRGRSVCDSCHKKLTALELIPVVSYLALGGKCKNCGTKIPARLTLVELLTAFAFVFTYLYFSQASYVLILALIVVCINIAIFFIDLDYGVIPDELVILFGIVSLFYALFVSGDFFNHLITGLVCFFLFLALYLATRGKGLGLGDVKIAFAMGFFLGFPVALVAFYFAFLTGAIVSVILIVYGKKGLKSAVPFGPFLASGTLFAYFFGASSIQLFASSFLGS